MGSLTNIRESVYFFLSLLTIHLIIKIPPVMIVTLIREAKTVVVISGMAYIEKDQADNFRFPILKWIYLLNSAFQQAVLRLSSYLSDIL